MTPHPFRTQSRNHPAPIPQGNGMEWNGMEEEWRKTDGSVSYHLTTEPGARGRVVTP